MADKFPQMDADGEKKRRRYWNRECTQMHANEEKADLGGRNRSVVLAATVNATGNATESRNQIATLTRYQKPETRLSVSASQRPV